MNDFKVDPSQYDNKCYIIAGGPSLKNFDWSLLTPDKFVIAINRSYEVLPDAQVVYFTDKDYWDAHKEKMLQHTGQLIRGALVPSREEQHPRVLFYQLTGAHGYETRPGMLKHGSNSTYAAINLAAAHFGFKTIYLLGVDMKWGMARDKNTSHWHTGHKRVDPESTYQKMITAYRTIVDPLQQAGVKVYNANPDSALDCFEKITIQEAVGMADEKYIGDHIEEALKKVGADKVAKQIERVTKKPCGCMKRKEQLNQIHRRLIGRPTPPASEPEPADDTTQ